MKPHPRLGYSEFLKNKFDHLINSYIPAEFIDTNNITYVIGFSSTVFRYYANRKNTKVISLINIYRYKDDSIKNKLLEYYRQYFGSIIFLENIEELKELLT